MPKIVIKGNTPSKKNSKQIIYKKGRVFIISSKQHQEWQLKGASPIKANELTLVFYDKTRHKADLTNRSESIMDILVDSGLIPDDNWFIISKLHLEFGGIDPLNPRCEIFYE